MERGDSVALVGHSGSGKGIDRQEKLLFEFTVTGKSSCVHLLTRLYEVTAGQILLDGLPLANYDQEWVREQIAVVSQEAVTKICALLTL